MVNRKSGKQYGCTPLFHQKYLKMNLNSINSPGTIRQD
jgi:hypothetical protein